MNTLILIGLALFAIGIWGITRKPKHWKREYILRDGELDLNYDDIAWLRDQAS